MAAKQKGKSRKKVKRFPYIEVNGIQNQYLDAALLQCFGEETIYNTVNNEFKILKKAGITTQDVMRRKYNHQELTQLLSPHLLENYDYYNFLVNQWDELQEHNLRQLFPEDFSKLSSEKWDQAIRGELDKGELRVYLVINILRFYKNGELKELLLPILQEEKYVIEFFNETGIRMELEGLEINWRDVTEQEDKQEEEIVHALEMEDFKMPKEVLEHPEEALKYASKIIASVSQQLASREKSEDFKLLFENEVEEKERWKEKAELLQRDLKSKDAQHQDLVKKNKVLTKDHASLTAKLDQAQKDSGRLGQTLGELRKEKEEIEFQKNHFERRIQSLEKERENVARTVEEEVKREFALKNLNMKEEFERQLDLLERQLEEMAEQLKYVQGENEQFTLDKETMVNELDRTKRDLTVVEQERNELFEQLQSSAAIQEVAADTNDDHDLLFDFNEGELEEYVDFDNKPTRN